MGLKNVFKAGYFFGSTVVGMDCFWKKISLICEAGNLQYVLLYMQRVFSSSFVATQVFVKYIVVQDES